MYIETAKEVLGKKKKKRKPWISEEAWSLIEQKSDINKRIIGTRSERIRSRLKDEYRAINKEAKRNNIRSDKRNWNDNIAKEAEAAANNRQMGTLYKLTKLLCNKPPRQSVAFEDQDGKLISGKEETLKRWSEHFKEVLNRDESNEPISDEEVNGEHIEETDTTELNRAELK